MTVGSFLLLTTTPDSKPLLNGYRRWLQGRSPVSLLAKDREELAELQFGSPIKFTTEIERKLEKR
jgi:hypothetical protein